jgi:hypothetical protein
VRSRTSARAALCLLFVVTITSGLTAAVAPRNFYDDFHSSPTGRSAAALQRAPGHRHRRALPRLRGPLRLAARTLDRTLVRRLPGLAADRGHPPALPRQPPGQASAPTRSPSWRPWRCCWSHRQSRSGGSAAPTPRQPRIPADSTLDAERTPSGSVPPRAPVRASLARKRGSAVLFCTAKPQRRRPAQPCDASGGDWWRGLGFEPTSALRRRQFSSGLLVGVASAG